LITGPPNLISTPKLLWVWASGQQRIHYQDHPSTWRGAERFAGLRREQSRIDKRLVDS
jgi:hypothetical protein